MTRRTKIVATIGPASESAAALDNLIAAGLDVVRLNLSHGTADDHLKHLRDVREAAGRAARHVAVLVDLPGPKVRTGPFPDDGALLVVGEPVNLVPGATPCSATTISVDYPSLLDDLRPGDRVILGDGAITMTVESLDESSASARVATGGRVQGRPGVHIPAERLRLTAPTDADLELLEMFATAGADFVAVSFVRSAADVVRARAVIGLGGPRLVAKIETAAAVADLDAIVGAADAVMVARGDLGIECALEDVPHLQKQIIRACTEAGKPVITATQMLESMIDAPAPTRAEVSDVANAVFDGTDAVMLSAETAIGHDPELVIRTMARIVERAEADATSAPIRGRARRDENERHESALITAAMSHAAFEAARDIGVAAIVCCTRSGLSARAMARYRPSAPLIGMSPDPATARSLALSWGIMPMVVATYSSTDEMVWFAVETAVHSGLVASGDLVAVLAGAPDTGQRGATDVLRIVKIK